MVYLSHDSVVWSSAFHMFCTDWDWSAVMELAQGLGPWVLLDSYIFQYVFVG